MRLLLAQSFFLVLFYAFIAVADDVEVCGDVAQYLEIKVIPFDSFDDNPRRNKYGVWTYATEVWTGTKATQITGVAVANAGIVSFRLDKDLFPELNV